jgi:hypothetical protein
MPNFREVYDDMIDKSSDESDDGNENSFVEDLRATKQQISGGGRAKRGRSKSPTKAKAKKPKAKAKSKAKSKSKSPKGKSKGKAKSKSKSRSPKGKAKIPAYPTGLKTQAGKNRAVYEGRAMKTGPGGLTKADLMPNKTGKIVSKKKSKKSRGNPHLDKWRNAVKQANEQLESEDPSFKGTIAPKRGSKAYKLAKEFHEFA